MARSSVRVTVVGDAGPLDVAVPRWMTAAELAAEYAATSGTGTPSGLVTPTGHALDPAAELQDLGVDNGDVLVVATTPLLHPVAREDVPTPSSPQPGRPVVQVVGAAVAGGAGGRRTLRDPVSQASPGLGPGSGATTTDPARSPFPAPAPDPDAGRRARSALLGLAAACAIGSAAVAAVAATQESGGLRWVCVGLFAVAAVATALPLTPGRIGGRLRAGGSAAFAAAAGFAAAYSDAAGGLLLGLAVAALCATGAAAVARAWLGPEEDDLADVALVVGGTASVLGVVMLLLGSSVLSFLAIAYGVAVVAARLLPYLVVDVPDEALLDLDRLQNTAWSAREAPRGSRRKRVMVRPDGVATVVRRSQRLLTAGTLVISGVVTVGGALLVREVERDVVGVSRVAMVLLGAAALALVARSVRARVPRLALRLSAALVTAWTGVLLLGAGDHLTTWWVFAAAACLGAITVSVAIALGQGWRSVWWARFADVVESLAVVLVVAAVPLASGIFSAVRSLVS
jgi:hypothetical protein